MVGPSADGQAMLILVSDRHEPAPAPHHTPTSHGAAGVVLGADAGRPGEAASGAASEPAASGDVALPPVLPTVPVSPLGWGGAPPNAPPWAPLAAPPLATPPLAAHAPAGLRAGLQALGVDRDDDPPVSDPYYRPDLAPVRPRLSPFALASVLVATLLSPLGVGLAATVELPDPARMALGASSIACALVAIGLGWAGRREVEGDPRRRSGFGLATAGMVVGLVLAVGWTTAFGVLELAERDRVARHDDEAGVYTREARSDRRGAGSSGSSGSSGSGSSGGSGSPGSGSPGSGGPRPVLPPTGTVPKDTATRKEGTVTIVEVGYAVGSFEKELQQQREEAEKAHEQFVLMVTIARCKPCEAFLAALKDPRMQVAMAGARLVRVDGEVFRKELEDLRYPLRGYPAFFLTQPDLLPRDGIDGGEWDEDIPENITPVMGPFLKGTYTKRRTEFRIAPRAGGVRL